MPTPSYCQQLTTLITRLRELKTTGLLETAVRALGKEYPADFVNQLESVWLQFLLDNKFEDDAALLQSVIQSMRAFPITLSGDELEVRDLFIEALSPLAASYRKILKPALTSKGQAERFRKKERNAFTFMLIKRHVERQKVLFNRQRQDSELVLSDTDEAMLTDKAKEAYGEFFRKFIRISRGYYRNRSREQFADSVIKLLDAAREVIMSLRPDLSAALAKQSQAQADPSAAIQSVLQPLRDTWSALPQVLREEQHYLLRLLRSVFSSIDELQLDLPADLALYGRFYLQFFATLLQSQQDRFIAQFQRVRVELDEQYVGEQQKLAEQKEMARLSSRPQVDEKAVAKDLSELFAAVSGEIRLLVAVRNVFAKFINWILNWLPWVKQRPSAIVRQRERLISVARVEYRSVAESCTIDASNKKRVLSGRLRRSILAADSPLRKRGVVGVEKQLQRVATLERLLPASTAA